MDPGFYSLKQERLISFWQQKTYFTDALKQGEPATKKRTRGKEGVDAQQQRHRPRTTESTNSEGADAQRHRSRTTESTNSEGADAQRHRSRTTESHNSEGVTNNAQTNVHETDQQLQQPITHPDNVGKEASTISNAQEKEVEPGADQGNQTGQAGTTAGKRRSARMRKPTQRLIETMQTEITQRIRPATQCPVRYSVYRYCPETTVRPMVTTIPY